MTMKLYKMAPRSVVRDDGKQIFPLHDKHQLHDTQLMAVSTGIKRPPLAGEWYLSGSLVGAYRAYEDMSCSYYIAKVIRVKAVTYYVEVEDV